MRLLTLLVLSLALIAPTRAFAQGERGQKQLDEALQLLNQEIAKDPKSVSALTARAEILELLEKFSAALADLNKVIELDKNNSSAYQQRGFIHFKMGKVKESIADFDRYIERVPKAKISHWQRGISYYYAGQYDNGRKQFEGYQEFDSNDVENAVWRFMCMVRADGIAKARQAILKIGDDKRVPMRQVYDLYQGVLKPEDVLTAANAGKVTPSQRNSQLFYAHLYVGIYYDLLGDKKKAFEHVNKAAEEHRIGHYMWDVARVHRDILATELKEKK